MPIPATPLAPGSSPPPGGPGPGYDALYRAWEEAGRPGMFESLTEGWMYRAYTPDASDPRPTFVLVCSSQSLSVALGTQVSWQRRKPLPVEEV